MGERHNHDCYQMGLRTWHHNPHLCKCACHPAEYRAQWTEAEEEA